MIIRALLWYLIDAYQMLIIIEAILSWFPQTPGSFVYQIRDSISTITAPYLNIFRNLVPRMNTSSYAIDFSPIIAFMVLGIVKRFI